MMNHGLDTERFGDFIPSIGIPIPRFAEMTTMKWCEIKNQSVLNSTELMIC